jgi:hypothetical protein
MSGPWVQQGLDESLTVADRQIETLMLFDRPPRRLLNTGQHEIGQRPRRQVTCQAVDWAGAPTSSPPQARDRIWKRAMAAALIPPCGEGAEAAFGRCSWIDADALHRLCQNSYFGPAGWGAAATGAVPAEPPPRPPADPPHKGGGFNFVSFQPTKLEKSALSFRRYAIALLPQAAGTTVASIIPRRGEAE